MEGEEKQDGWMDGWMDEGMMGYKPEELHQRDGRGGHPVRSFHLIWPSATTSG